MKINFSKITRTPTDFTISFNNLVMSGEVVYTKYASADLKASLKGSCEVDCASCGDTFTKELNEQLELRLSDGLYSASNETLEDIIEIENGTIDFDELLQSELELIKNDYHRCESCLNTTEEN